MNRRSETTKHEDIMARRQTKPSVDDGEQQDIEGTRSYNRKIEPRAKRVVHATQQWQLWGKEMREAKPELIEVMEAEGVDEYILKTGDKCTLTDGKQKISIVSAKDEDGDTVLPERQVSIETD